MSVMIDQYFEIYTKKIKEYGENTVIDTNKKKIELFLKYNIFMKCEHNKNQAYCKICKGSQICEHNNIRYVCRQCGGGKGICEHNRVKSQCKECGGSQICEHNKRKAECKECNGSQICEHKKQKNKCKVCKGSGICEHNRERSTCRECGGSQICDHDKMKSTCKECLGGSICPHDKVKAKCKECEGSAFCEHQKIKSRCKDCGGNSICEHNKRKDSCIECDGNSICEHKKRKCYCIDCNGSQICTHKKRKEHCKECGGSAYCEHDKMKNSCIICSPNSNRFCKDCRLYMVSKNTNYLCSYCNPDKPTRQKKKELRLKKFLEDNNYEFIYNKYCSYEDIKYFPDFIIDCNTFKLIIECDEYGHRDRDKKCEKIREDNIILALNKNCVFIRFNPDNKQYRKKSKIEIKEKVLKSYIDYYTSKAHCDIEVCYLFY